MFTDEAVFVDSWAWLALSNRLDNYHEVVVRAYEEIRRAGHVMLTSDYVLDEVITALFTNVSFDHAVEFIETLLSAIGVGQIALERVDEERSNSAWMLRKRYQDKPEISFTDLTSFVIMRELGISRAFTGDKHFEEVNLGFEMLPKSR
jgi:predicted nucleic acid-binding protein